MGMSLSSGGHLSHGAKVNISGKFYNAVGYGLNPQVFIDFEQVLELAELHRPKLIICGATAYPRAVDWQKFRDIADRVGAFLLADITHIAGLVIAGLHASPIDVAHFTVTCTHKQLYGPRGGLILMGREWDAPSPTGKGTLSSLIQSGVFPFTQGAPIINKIVAKARTLDRAGSDEFKALMCRILTLSRALADSLMKDGMEVVSGGTDNHIVLVNVRNSLRDLRHYRGEGARGMQHYRQQEFHPRGSVESIRDEWNTNWHKRIGCQVFWGTGNGGVRGTDRKSPEGR